MNRQDFPNNIDKSWTLFLDRDGVLNRRIVDDYVRKWEHWEWLPGVLETLASLKDVFGKIVILTNQRGISRGLYSEKDLKTIHKQMLADIEQAGGRVDAIFHCPHDRDEGCDCRKPKPGMLFQAAAAHPEIDLSKSVMVGDSLSDMEAAAAAKVLGVYIGSVRTEMPSNVLTTLPDLATFGRLMSE
jgi:D-glycero-D-manno-heptose 1,7-bisphosphate phosphatase